VANGTAALRCALAAIGVGCGDEVVVPAFTFIATVNAVVASGAVPVFAEVDDTLGLDPRLLEDCITERTAAIVAVHLENIACDLHGVLAVANRYRVPVIEDTAQAIGATYHRRHLGTFGALGAFSLQQEKNITAGEGGLVVTDDEELYLRATRYSDQGGQFVTSYASARGEELTQPFAGENLRMGELAGAVARVQIGRLPDILHALRRNKARIIESVGDIEGLVRRRRPDPDGDGSSSITWFLPDAPTAKRFAAAVRAEGVPCAQMYRGRPVYLSPSVLARRTATDKGGPWTCAEHPTDRTYFEGLCPQTEALVARSTIVPVGVGYDERDCDDVAAAVRKVARGLLS
jgi:8-amino-3,8-dideoxy-alpha-D-manno-octulosonate transaminase